MWTWKFRLGIHLLDYWFNTWIESMYYFWWHQRNPGEILPRFFGASVQQKLSTLEDDLKTENNQKNKDKPKNVDNLKNLDNLVDEDYPYNEDNLKNERDLNSGNNPKMEPLEGALYITWKKVLRTPHLDNQSTPVSKPEMLSKENMT